MSPSIYSPFVLWLTSNLATVPEAEKVSGLSATYKTSPPQPIRSNSKIALAMAGIETARFCCLTVRGHLTEFGTLLSVNFAMVAVQLSLQICRVCILTSVLLLYKGRRECVGSQGMKFGFPLQEKRMAGTHF